ncbi:hypothetical protein MOPEL_009_00610 [Mobilicoccus pelagius NBRC 104925]|uniref:Uncharacterized protein n=1 Tax=Mobilicoccus pelagius NBRC 104925 TaxID=1089455 RepID=H5UNR3_9MICO|nr:hypothetical protein MOPEL_009_00610 [Mobilicoccus pelagius NBRC 104925]
MGVTIAVRRRPKTGDDMGDTVTPPTGRLTTDVDDRAPHRTGRGQRGRAAGVPRVETGADMRNAALPARGFE